MTTSNPIALPSSGRSESIPLAVPGILNWEYSLQRQGLTSLYEKSKRLHWNAATDIDWSLEVDPLRPPPDSTAAMMNELMRPPRPFDDKKFAEFHLHRNAWMLSQFLHGEQGALVAASQLVTAVPWLEAKLYAAQQAADEARHVEVYQRYLSTKLHLSYPVNPQLRTLLGQIVSDRRWDMIYLGMQILIEGLALAAFGFMRIADAHDTLLHQITSLVMRDEARHVAFGVMTLAEVYQDLTQAERREREEFVVEAAVLMRDRLLMNEIWEPLGLNQREWTEWSLKSQFLVGFRHLLFSKIIPNLRRLGLLTPYVRSHLKRLGVLEFEHFPDSMQDEGSEPSPELLQFMGTRLLKTSP